LLFVHNYLADQSSAELLAEAKRYGALVASKAHVYSTHPNSPDPDRNLRVGIVSGDLRQHPVGYFVESVLDAFANQGPSRLEFFAYSNYFEFDTTSERIRTSCANWFSILGRTDEMVAQQIRDDRIDILIDIAGHTGHNRLPLFAWKPAPVQVSWLGYFATTGVAAIDYLIADPWTLPETEEANFTETIWRLPETRLCFTPPDLSVAVTPLPALERGYVTFGNFNNLAKMNDDVVALWARILNAVPNSRLSLKTQHFNDPAVQENVFARFEAHGINRGRLVLEGYAPRADYLASYNRVDIALDPFPYTGGTTTVEALWMGVPVLTLAGKQFLARQGVGLLVNAGLPNWVASDSDDYFARAVAHASDLQHLASLRDGLRQQLLSSPVCDAQRFAQNFETALRSMWERWCQGQQIMD
jgi:predicted O-linked N-acetylglucosamine transferase (SPINDLY family)